MESVPQRYIGRHALRDQFQADFLFIPNHFLIEYLSVGIQQSVTKVQLQHRILSCCTSNRLRSKPKLDGIALLET